MIVFIKPESFVNTEGNGSLIHMGKKAADRYRQLQHYYIISYHIYSRFYRYKETKEIMKLHVINQSWRYRWENSNKRSQEQGLIRSNPSGLCTRPEVSIPQSLLPVSANEVVC